MATLRALIVEDSPDDAALLVRELEQGGYQVSFERVDSRDSLDRALDEPAWAVIFADYTMPGFSGTQALEMVRERGVDVPFMFVSGTIGEDLAVEAMKAGASDYFIKGNLRRLIPAVARELADAAERRDRKRLEAEGREARHALRASEERLRLLFEHIADAILVFDAEGRMRFVSASVREVLGYEEEELLGRSSFDLVHLDDLARARECVARTMTRADAKESVELRIRHSDGTWRDMDCVLRNLAHRPTVGGIVVTYRDITDRKRLEAEYLQAQRMESVGRLAGGIAHDFNNFLTAIMAHADLLLLETELTDQQQVDIRGIKHAAGRASTLTRQLLAFSRRQVLDVRPLDLNEVIEQLVNMLERLLGDGAEVLLLLEPELGTVQADAAQVEQVLVNLAVNARDAMPEGGRLTIQTQNVEPDASWNVHPPLHPRRYVRLTVVDTGIGMGPDTRARIFEPFFTTKPVGEGTGLGLATSYGIVKQSGGEIRVRSEEKLGTTFDIYFPRVDVPASAFALPSEEEPIVGGAETILLIVDAEAVRKLAARVLNDQGYTVLAAATSVQADEYLQDEEREINLMLVDAGLAGEVMAVAERAQGLRPDLRVLFMSGHAAPDLAERGLIAAETPLLEKPFTAVSLARKVRDLLDR